MEAKFERFTSLISKTYKCIQKIKSVEMSEIGLKGSQVLCLYHLYNHDGKLSVTKLSTMCDEDKGAVSRTLKTLEEKGYLYVDRNTNQKYRNTIKLTENGLSAGKRISERIEAFESLGSKGISQDDLDKFYSVLNMMYGNLLAFSENCFENK